MAIHRYKIQKASDMMNHIVAFKIAKKLFAAQPSVIN